MEGKYRIVGHIPDGIDLQTRCHAWHSGDYENEAEVDAALFEERDRNPHATFYVYDEKGRCIRTLSPTEIK